MPYWYGNRYNYGYPVYNYGSVYNYGYPIYGYYPNYGRNYLDFLALTAFFLLV